MLWLPLLEVITPLDGVFLSVFQDCSVIRGAKWLKPSPRVTVPSWDLSLVLQGLVNIPFEALESGPFRFWTLKMVFMTAITSLR